MSAALRILAVEDSVLDGEVMFEYLRVSREVEFARVDTLAALKAHVSGEPWDAILMDYSLRGFTAPEALRLVRGLDPDVPCIIVSGTVTTETAIEILKGGAQDCVLKGNLDRLWPAIDGALARLAQHRAQAQVVERLRDSERRARLVVDSARDAFIGMDGQGIIIDWNVRAEELLGWPREEVMGRRVADTVIPEPLRQAHRDGLMRFVQTGKAKVLDQLLELTALRRDGSTVPIEIQISAIPMEASFVFGAFIRDVSSRVRSDKCRRAEYEVTRTLASALSLSDAASSVLGTMMEALDWDVGCLREVQKKSAALECIGFRTKGGLPSSRFEALTQEMVFHSSEGLPGRVWEQGKPDWVSDVVGDGRFLRAREAHAADLHAGVIFPFRIAEEIVGTVELFSRQVRPRDAEMMQTFENIGSQLGQFAQRCRAEESLKASEAQLRHSQKMDSIGRLAGGIAHDFNNLLTVIAGCSEFAMESLAADHPARSDIQSVLKAAASASALTRQLLAFSRRQVLVPRILDLNEVLASMERMIRRVIGEDIELDCRMAPGLGRVLADSGQIEQVVMNLAANARDAMPGGGQLTLETASVHLEGNLAQRHLELKPGNHARLSVRDTGSGMDEQTLVRIFEPFFTTKDKSRGTGLGLATVFGIVKQSGGGIYVYSEVGHGTTFKVYLPITDRLPQDSAAPARRPPRPSGEVCVLLVEDDAEIRHLCRNVLQRHGYRVLEAANPDEGVRLGAGHGGPIHLLLTDVVMPGMSGKALSALLQQNLPELRVLFMSGYTDDALADHGVLPPEVCFLEKPFTPDALLRKVHEALD